MQVHAFNVLDTGYGPGGRATTVSDLLLKIAPQSFDLGFLESELSEIYVVGLSEPALSMHTSIHALLARRVQSTPLHT